MKVKKNMNTSSKVHLAKYLKECGNYTKSQVQDLIKQKRVLVNHHYYPLSYIVRYHMFIICIINQLALFVPTISI